MKKCERCQSDNPDTANFCMICGEELLPGIQSQAPVSGKSAGNWPLFWLTLGGSLVLSWLLIAVFHLPVFILGAVLPLVWFSSRK